MEKFKPAIVHVVDDDEAVRDSMRALLESYGMEVRDYASPDAFVAAGYSSLSGCLLLDLHMPGMTGLELLERLRADGSKLPVVIMTGRSDSVLKERAWRAGAVALLDKPVDENELMSALSRALALAEASSVRTAY